MRRLFWLALGATVGVLLVRRASRAAERLTPGGLADSVLSGLGGLGDALREMNSEIRAGMAEREAELRAQLGLDGTHDAVDAHLLDQPAGPSAGRSGGPKTEETHADGPRHGSPPGA